jgi:hypothetical protein
VRRSSTGTDQSTWNSTDPITRLPCRVQFSNGRSAKYETGRMIRRSSQVRTTT